MRCRHMTLAGPKTSTSTVSTTAPSPLTVFTSGPALRPGAHVHCGPLPAGVSPGLWTAALTFLGAGAALASLAAVAGLLACCVHAVCGKSILGVCGAAQAGAGVLYLLGLSLYAGGWGAERVQRLCGSDASPFYLDSCSLGREEEQAPLDRADDGLPFDPWIRGAGIKDGVVCVLQVGPRTVPWSARC